MILQKKKVLEDFFGEGVWDPPKHWSPMNRKKAKLVKWALIGFGITIVSRVLSGNPIIFGNKDRILTSESRG
ncbi:MAG: hypothetical protein GX958_03155 [Desulfitobacterium sp.]|nr:hypothetical protein [Desulfitobacterium sp.]